VPTLVRYPLTGLTPSLTVRELAAMFRLT
jgi:hypothetical protein